MPEQQSEPTPAVAADPSEVRLTIPLDSAFGDVLGPQALAFVASLHRQFNPIRERLLARRTEVQAEIDAGGQLDFLPDTREIRESTWTVSAAPPGLVNRRVEMTGPTDRKMLINGLNCGASGYMADFEDANSPTWENLVEGQVNLRDAIDGTISLTGPDGRAYRLNEHVATLLVRPRGWHMVEKHMLVDGSPVSASLFDFGLYVFTNAQRLQSQGRSPYLYLPKLQSHLEARLWNDVFVAAQEALGVPRGSIRATVLIETLPAAFEMEEILFELREHSGGLNAGRWDYIFSSIKTMRNRRDFILPDRKKVTMTVPFMRAYTELLVRTCHRRGAHAMGGMAAFIPNRRDPEVTELAIAQVRADKRREAEDGFDGTWVAHPDLVAVAREEFDAVLGPEANQVSRSRDDVQVSGRELLDFASAGSDVTEDGVRNNISVGLRYLTSWLGGTGAAAIFNLMEDVATAEIARSQLWQWVRAGAKLADGTVVSEELFTRIESEEAASLEQDLGPSTPAARHLGDARGLLRALVLSKDFIEFLTTPGYELLVTKP